jgi:hypothetical protein
MQALELNGFAAQLATRYGLGGEPNYTTLWGVKPQPGPLKQLLRAQRVRRNPPQRQNPRGEISIGTRFGANAHDAYRDWKTKWWREAIQNSVDARASSVQCNVTETPEGSLVECADDGKGMDWGQEEVVWNGVRIPGFLAWRGLLFDKFLALGGTGKGEAGEEPTIGGFGIAKQLLLLPWAWWSVLTKTRNGPPIRVYGTNKFYGVQIGDEIAQGAYRTFALPQESFDAVMAQGRGFLEELVRNGVLPSGEPPKEFQEILRHAAAQGPALATLPNQAQGTRLSAFMNKGNATSDSNAVTFILWSCYPRVQFIVNGREVKAERKAGPWVRELAPGVNVHYAKKAKDTTSSYVVAVRAVDPRNKGNSLYMFNAGWLMDSVPGYLSVEVTADTKLILTDTREGFRIPEIATALEAYTSELVSNFRAATQKPPYVMDFEGLGKQQAVADETKVLLEIPGLVDAAALSAEFLKKLKDSVDSQRKEQEQNTKPSDPPGADTSKPSGAEATAVAEAVAPESPDDVKRLIKFLVWQPDFRILVADDLRDAGFIVPRQFEPDRLNMHLFKLMNVWTAMLRYVLAKTGGTRYEWGTGWYFGKDAHGATQMTSKWILLNPYVIPGKDGQPATTGTHSDPDAILLDARIKDHRNWLLALAVHEATHFQGFGDHNDPWSSQVTYNEYKLGTSVGLNKVVAAALAKKRPKRKDALAEVGKILLAAIEAEGRMSLEDLVRNTNIERKLIVAGLKSLLRRKLVNTLKQYGKVYYGISSAGPTEQQVKAESSSYHKPVDYASQVSVDIEMLAALGHSRAGGLWVAVEDVKSPGANHVFGVTSPTRWIQDRGEPLNWVSTATDYLTVSVGRYGYQPNPYIEAALGVFSIVRNPDIYQIADAMTAAANIESRKLGDKQNQVVLTEQARGIMGLVVDIGMVTYNKDSYSYRLVS